MIAKSETQHRKPQDREALTEGEFEKRSKRGRPRGKGTQIVYDTLREEILTLVAKPGDHLDETQLEKRFGVSRTPIREALIRLQADRLVRFSANRGHFVEVINLNDVPRIFEALDLYQAAVFRLAAHRISDSHLQALRTTNEAYWAAAQGGDYSCMTEKNHEFHTIVAEAADNQFLFEGYSTVLNFALRLTYLMFENADDGHAPQPVSYYKQIYNEHQQMIDLLAAGNADALEEISIQHIKLFSSRVADFMQSRERLRSRPHEFKISPSE